MEKPRSWMWNHFSKRKGFIKCNICDKLYTYKSGWNRMKIHLYYSHKISNEADYLEWINKKENNSVWKYFSKEDGYIARCKRCGIITHAYQNQTLERHVKTHPEIVAALREEIACTWLSEHFTFTNSHATCKLHGCDYTIDIIKGEHHLISHFNYFHKYHEYSGHEVKSKDNNENGMMQSVNKENYTGTYPQPGVMAVQINRKRNWFSQYFTKVDNFTTKCNICNKIYKYRISTLKAHLCFTHNIFHKHDNFIWKNKMEDTLLWRYFLKEDGFIARCKCCDKCIRTYTDANIKKHMNTVHPEIATALGEEITCTWLSRYFTFKDNRVICKLQDCSCTFCIFQGSNYLKFHLEKCHGINNQDVQQEQIISVVKEELEITSVVKEELEITTVVKKELDITTDME